MGNPADLKPGSMISVQLMSGDFSVGADGTVTHIDGNRVYAFGHRFLDIGSTALPFARAEVLTLLANAQHVLQNLHRQGMDGHHLPGPQHRRRRRTRQAPRHGARHDRRSRATANRSRRYQMQMVNDTLLSPLLLQMAVFSAIDATERTVGATSIRVTGQIEFQNASAPAAHQQYVRRRQRHPPCWHRSPPPFPSPS